MKLVTILGARPQFVKAATVSRALLDAGDIEEILVHTGQHFDVNMSDVFFEELDIPEPAHHLGIQGGSHGQQTGAMLTEIEKVLLKEVPDMVLVYGDTNSTLAGALAAAKLHIPIAHVEAGLRSFNMNMPEEINRILTDRISDLLFAPTQIATKNLRRDGLAENKIIRTGDVMLDATLYHGIQAEKQSTVLADLGLSTKGYVLVTVHRAGNTDNRDRLKLIFDSLERLAAENRIVLPLHPRTRKSLGAIAFPFEKSAIEFTDPVGYLDMLQLEKNAELIITDSGGIQKEAYFHKVPCVTLRKETEWVELVENGYNLLAEPENLPEIVAKARGIDFARAMNLYGNGAAAIEIVKAMGVYLGSGTKSPIESP